MPLVRSIGGGYTTLKMHTLSKLLSDWRFSAMLAFCAVVGFSAAFLVSQPVAAQDDEENEDRLWTQQTCEAEGGTWQGDKEDCEFTDEARDRDPNFLVERYIMPITRFLAAIVGLVVVISIVVGGIQYASAEDDPQKVAKAKDRILNSLLGLLTFMLLYGLLEWIIPGGILN